MECQTLKEMSSYEILDEALIVKNQHINVNDTKFITNSTYRNEKDEHYQVGVNLITLAWPFGRCFCITPPPIPQGSQVDVTNTLTLTFNETIFHTYYEQPNMTIYFKMYFMDKTNSLKIYPDESEMKGDLLKIRLNKQQKYVTTFKTEISRSQHVPEDPLLACTEYSLTNSYHECTQNELLSSFHEILGCAPPLLAKDITEICNGRFNVSSENDTTIRRLFKQLYHHDIRFKCKTPCTTNKYTTRLVHKVPYTDTVVKLVFDRTISVALSTFSINSQTFLTRLGGSVSTGRTLLWVLVSLFGVTQVMLVTESLMHLFNKWLLRFNHQ